MVTLREYNEKISSMWVYEANGKDTPDTVSYGSAKEFTWRCNNNPKHVFKKKVLQMFNNKTGEPIGCIFCEAERPLPFPGETDLFSILPIAEEMWDYDKNIGFDTSCIHPGTPKKAWFKCENGHLFQRAICDFVENQNCSVCRKLKNVIAKFPHMVKQWHFEKNTGIDINLTSANSSQKVWWKCKKCNYEWQAQISSRRASKGLCPCCEVRIVVQKGATDLFALFPWLEEEYDFKKNTDIDKSFLSVTTSTPVWWKCKSGHEWQVSPCARIKWYKGKQHISKCPYCQGRKRFVSYSEEYPELKESFMAEKNGRLIDTITSKERRDKFWWICNKCKNEFESLIESMIRSYSSSAKGCPYCAGKTVKRENSFAYIHPEMMDEYNSNNIIDPYTVTEKSNKNVKWICRNNSEHRWNATFRQRASGTGNCPECRGWHYNKMLWQECPDLEKYYDTKKNERLFNSFSYKSNERVWWICEKGHSFSRAIYHAVMAKTFECPICNNKQLEIGVNDLASQFPNIAAEFDCKKNGITPDQIIKNTVTEYWWLCKEGHSFVRSPYRRINGFQECPVCARAIVVKGINDFQTAYSKVIDIWDYDKNDVKPDEISDRHHGKFAFRCKKGHMYESYLRTVIFNNFECLICNNVIIQLGVNSLLDTHPDLAKEFSPNEVRNPDEFTKDMAYSILWRCPVCQGDYSCSIKDREINDDSCPYCNDNRLLLGFNTLIDTHPELAEEWSENNDKSPYEVTKEYAYSAKWRCMVCNGEFIAKVKEREIGDDSCPYCNRNRALLGFNSLFDTHPELAKEWSPTNRRGADTYVKETKKYVKWICPTCKGEYPAKISEREVGDDSCPYCNNKQVLIGYNSLLDTHATLTLEWGKSNEYGPEKYYKNSTSYVSWECPKCHGEYNARIRDREIGDNLCPYCRNIKPLRDYNTLQIRQPDLLAEWDFVNNYLLCHPNNVLVNYSHKVWWKCKNNNHKYLMSPQQKMYYKKRNWISCPYCKGLRNKKKYII